MMTSSNNDVSVAFEMDLISWEAVEASANMKRQQRELDEAEWNRVRREMEEEATRADAVMNAYFSRPFIVGGVGIDGSVTESFHRTYSDASRTMLSWALSGRYVRAAVLRNEPEADGALPVVNEWEA